MSEPIVLLFSDPLSEMDYKESYLRFAQFAQYRNIDLRFVFGVENVLKGNRFKSYFKIVNNELQEYKEYFSAGIVYLRNRVEISGINKRVNNSFLESICRDKYLTYTKFPNFVKKTILISPSTISNLETLKTNLVALKPRFGANGDDVQIVQKKEINSAILANKEYIVQELIDSFSGIPGLVDTRHELRIFILNGTIGASYLRIPQENSYIANISRGAKEKQIQLSDIPSSTIAVIQSIDSTFKDIIPRLYTVDIMYENGRPWVVELNDNPGMPDISVQPFTDNYYNTLLNFFVNS